MCMRPMLCCNGVTCDVDSLNDPLHCGDCGTVCTDPNPVCSNGQCGPAPCTGGTTCNLPATCCGTSCCDANQLCCEFIGPNYYFDCYTPTPTQATCPPGNPQAVSDRNVKRDIVPVDPQSVLDGLARVPVSTWSYRSDDPSVRHMGPMAQDFHGEFGLGNTDKGYSLVDSTGVSFAAIQALYARVQEQEARLERLERENAACRSAPSR